MVHIGQVTIYHRLLRTKQVLEEFVKLFFVYLLRKVFNLNLVLQFLSKGLAFWPIKHYPPPKKLHTRGIE